MGEFWKNVMSRLSRLLFMSVVLMTSLVALAGCRSAEQKAPPVAGQGTLSVGDVAPSFTLSSAQGTEVSLSDFAGKTNALLYFNMAYG